MADAYILVGEFLNIAARGHLSGSSEDADRPASNAVDRDPSTQSFFNAIAADVHYEDDLDELIDSDGVHRGSFEGSTFDEGYTDIDNGASNTCVEETTIIAADGGAKSCEMQLVTAGAGNLAGRQIDIWCQPGEYRSIMGSLYGHANIDAKAEVSLPELGYYLLSGGTWTTTPTDLWTKSGTGWQNNAALAFQIPELATAQRRRVKLRLKLYTSHASNTGTVYADGFYTWAHWDTVSIHGTRNLGPVTCQLRSSTDGFSGSDVLVASPTISRPTFWHRESSRVTSRWMRVVFVGTNHEIVRIGQIVVGQAIVLTRRASPGTREGFRWAQIRSGIRVFAMADERTRVFEAPWKWFGDTQWEQWIDQVLFVGNNGRWPVVFIPLSTEPAALYAMMEAEFEVGRETVGVRKASRVTFTEMPLPTTLP